MALCTSLFVYEAPWTLLFSHRWRKSRHLYGSVYKLRNSVVTTLVLPCVPLQDGFHILYLWGEQWGEALCSAAALEGAGEYPEGPWTQKTATSEQLPQLQKHPFTGHQQTTAHSGKEGAWKMQHNTLKHAYRVGIAWQWLRSELWFVQKDKCHTRTLSWTDHLRMKKV